MKSRLPKLFAAALFLAAGPAFPQAYWHTSATGRRGGIYVAGVREMISIDPIPLEAEAA